MTPRLPPNSAGVWVECPGSVRIAERIPDTSTDRAEGDAAHWVAAEAVRGAMPALGVSAPNGMAVTQEMLDGAALYAAAVWSRIDPSSLWIEHELPMTYIEGQTGVPDTYGIGVNRYVLHNVEYKFGHRFVDAFENWECISHTLAAFDHLVATGVWAPTAEAHITAEITVVQPRNYDAGGPVRSWSVRMDHLRAHRNILSNAAGLSQREDAPTKVGPQCRLCDARHRCSTLQAAAYDIAQFAGTVAAADLTPQQVGNELRWLHRMQAILSSRVDGLETQAESVLRRGGRVPHYELQQGNGRERWNDPAAAIAIAAVFGHDIAKPQEAITPAQARAKGLPPEVIAQYAVRPPGELKLVPANTTQSRKIFGG